MLICNTDSRSLWRVGFRLPIKSVVLIYILLQCPKVLVVLKIPGVDTFCLHCVMYACSFCMHSHRRMHCVLYVISTVFALKTYTYVFVPGAFQKAVNAKGTNLVTILIVVL